MKLSAICKICAGNANYTYRHTGTSQNLAEMIGGADQYMPLCRECYHEKLDQDTKASLTSPVVVPSEDQSASTTFNDSGHDNERHFGEQLLDMDNLRLTNSASENTAKD